MIHLRTEETAFEDDSVNSELDKEIFNLQHCVSHLKTQLSILASTILSSQSTISSLCHLHEQKEKLVANGDPTHLLLKAKIQCAHNQTNLYRLCATITSFTIQDPDPNAVDQGHILGLRFDVSTEGKFIRPYYVMLNRPWGGGNSKMLNVHRHTLLPAIPIKALVNKYLPSPEGILAEGTEGCTEVPKQSLLLFSRALRHSILAYHNRLSILRNIRKDFNIEAETNGRMSKENFLLDVSAIDAEIKNIHIEWKDGRIGRVVVDDNGEVIKCVVTSKKSRHRVTERMLLGKMNNLNVNLREDNHRRTRALTVDELD